MKVNQCKKFDRSILIHYCADSLEAWTGQCTLGHQNPQDIYLLFITNWVSNATSIQDIFHTSEVFIDDEWKINSSYNHKGFVWWREQGILLKWTVQCVMSSYKSCPSQHCTFTSIYIYTCFGANHTSPTLNSIENLEQKNHTLKSAPNTSKQFKILK